MYEESDIYYENCLITKPNETNTVLKRMSCCDKQGNKIQVFQKSRPLREPRVTLKSNTLPYLSVCLRKGENSKADVGLSVSKKKYFPIHISSDGYA